MTQKLSPALQVSAPSVGFGVFYFKLYFMKSEEENKEILINAISPFFNISEERWGKHVYGDNVRIDMIVQPKRHDQWRGGKNTLLGIEVKPDYDNFNHITGLLVQAIDYRNSKWRLKGGDFRSEERRVGKERRPWWAPERRNTGALRGEGKRWQA